MDVGADHTVFVAAVAASTAILAALIAAISADMRQRRQLKHDREIQDLTELRSVLDEAIVAYEQAIRDITWMFVPDPDRDDDESEAVGATLDRMRAERFTEGMKAVADHRDRMMVVGRRIAIRIGEAEPVSEIYRRVVSATIDAIRALHAEERRQREAPGSASELDVDEWLGRLVAERKMLVAAAVALVGSRLPKV